MRSLKKRAHMTKGAWTEPRGTPLFWNQMEDRKSAEENEEAGERGVQAGEGTIRKPEAAQHPNR